MGIFDWVKKILDGSILPSDKEVYSKMIDGEFRIFIDGKLEGCN